MDRARVGNGRLWSGGSRRRMPGRRHARDLCARPHEVRFFDSAGAAAEVMATPREEGLDTAVLGQLAHGDRLIIVGGPPR